jgi:ferrous iron transport protein B
MSDQQKEQQGRASAIPAAAPGSAAAPVGSNKPGSAAGAETAIAVVGNPNSGKTTLFNGLTGGRQRIGNWPGVTVEKIEGRLRADGRNISVVDLPGIYSLSAYSEDEVVARDYILSGASNLIVNIIDATNLERNLFLTTQLLEMKVPLLIVINMMDLAAKRNITIDVELLSKKLGLPVLGISAVEDRDIEKVKQLILTDLANSPISDARIDYPNEIEDAIGQWLPRLSKVARSVGADERWVATKLLEKDEWIREKVLRANSADLGEIDNAISRIEAVLHETTDGLVTDYRYGFIHALSTSVVRRSRSRENITDRIDRIVMNRVAGIPIFLAAMYVVFWATINLGGAFIDFFDIFFDTLVVGGLRALLTAIASPPWLTAIIADGIGAGIRTVATFIPIIFMMFLMLSLLEDSGYMARAAYIMDGFMRRIGLPGKSFVPLIVGFGCTVPAVMASRTLDNRKDKFLTVFITPLMSCGARLPVYALLATVFFADAAGNVVYSLYLAGIVIAVLTGLLLKRTLFQGEPSHFIMELPPYHPPRPKHIMIHTWIRLKVFMVRAGTVIVLAVTLLSIVNSLGVDGSLGNEDSEKSLLSKVGKVLTPVFTPMGIEQKNWPATVALLSGVFAKEAVVGTLNSLYTQMDAKASAAKPAAEAAELSRPPGVPAGSETRGYDFWGGMGEAFSTIPPNVAEAFGLSVAPAGGQEGLGGNEKIFAAMRSRFDRGPFQVYAYLLFVLVYFPCLGAFGTIVRELGKGYGFLNALYLTLLGWIIATLFYQITVAHQLIWIAVPLVLLGLIVGLFAYLGKTAGIKLEEES